MESIVQAMGVSGFVVLAMLGAGAGWIASLAHEGRHRTTYLVSGAVAALAAPPVLMAVGVTAVLASGLLSLMVAALAGAAVVLAIARYRLLRA